MRHHNRPRGRTLRKAALSAALLGLTLAAPTFAGPPPDAAKVAQNPSVRQVAQADTDFGFRLLAQLAPEKGHANVFFSPFSISQALGLALNGAAGTTRQGIASTLGLGAMTTGEVNAANGLLLPSLENPDPQVQINVANALWLQTGETFRPTFQAACKQAYGADMETLNLRGPSGAPTINGWVKAKTHGKIDKLVSAFDLRAATSVLTNAVYFHGQWSTPFNKAATQTAPFTRADGTQKQVPLMTRTGKLSYLKGDGFQAVRLPYGQGRLAMYVFLPKTASGLDGFVGTATAARFSGWVAAMHPAQVSLFLPRFHADDSRRLKEPLSQMGMAKAFGRHADFSLMSQRPNAIGEVIHKATLDVDEEGTTATAATGVVMMRSQAMQFLPPVVVRVDHPFLCVLRDDATGAVLFLGAIREA